MVKENLIITSLLICLCFTSLLTIFNNIDLHILSSASLIAVMGIIFLFRKKIVSDIKLKHEIINFNFIFKIVDNYNKKNGLVNAFLVVLFSTIVGILSIYILIDRIDLESLDNGGINPYNFLLTTSIINGFVMQIGGWILQTFMVLFLSIFLDGQSNFNNYLKVIGFSYVGFLIGSIITLIYHYFTLPNTITLEEFKIVMDNNIILKIIGKYAEYLTLVLVAYGIMKIEKFSFSKAIFISFFPSIILISLKILFKNIIP